MNIEKLYGQISENICNCEILMSNAPLEMSFNKRVHYVKMSWLSFLQVGCSIWMSFFVATTLKIDCSLFKSLSKWNLFEFAIHLQIHILVIIFFFATGRLAWMFSKTLFTFTFQISHNCSPISEVRDAHFF